MDKEEEFTKTFRHFNQGTFMLIAFPDQPFFWASCYRRRMFARNFLSDFAALNDLNPAPFPRRPPS
jgi:hypothetical protein